MDDTRQAEAQQREQARAHLAEFIARVRAGDENVTDEQLTEAYHGSFKGVISNAESVARGYLMAGAPLCLARPQLADKILEGVIYTLTGSPSGSSTAEVEAWAEEVAERIAAVNRELYGDPSPEESSRWVMAKVADGTFHRLAVREYTLQRDDAELREALGDDNAREGWFYRDQWDVSALLESTKPASLVFFMGQDMDRARAAFALVAESLDRYDPEQQLALWTAQWSGKSPATPLENAGRDGREDWVDGNLPRLFWVYQREVVASTVFGADDDEQNINRHTRALAERLEE